MALNSRSLASGTRIGAYTVRATLGHGANATVYLAEDRRDGRRVALKALHNDRTQEVERAPQRMRREVELLQRVQHPGVCRVFEMGDEHGLLYVAMEYIDGQTLEAALRVARRFASPRVLRLMRDLCQALAAAHDQDILHRDLKPGNVMLRADGTPTLLDFGYATAPDVSRVTATGAWVGTLQYVAPEILRNEPATILSDLYSLGAIMYQCLSGQLPFGGRSYGEVASAKIYQDPPPLEELVPELSPAVVDIVRRTLRREPSERFTTTHELGAALAAILSEEKRHEPTQVVRQRKTAVAAPSAAPSAAPAPKAATLPSKPVVVAPAAPPTTATPKEQHAWYVAALTHERSLKGFVVGDLSGVEALERTAALELAAGKVAPSCECLRLAHAELCATALDEAFIRGKLQRFAVTHQAL